MGIKQALTAILLSILITNNITSHSQEVPEIKEILSEKELDCLANNIFYEAGMESEKGQLAVAFVTLNRTSKKGFPSTVCGVVKEQKVKGACQFSWYCDPSKSNMRLRLIDPETYRRVARIARMAAIYKENIKGSDPTHGALYFHNAESDRQWTTGLKMTGKIGNHFFYR